MLAAAEHDRHVVSCVSVLLSDLPRLLPAEYKTGPLGAQSQRRRANLQSHGRHQTARKKESASSRRQRKSPSLDGTALAPTTPKTQV